MMPSTRPSMCSASAPVISPLMVMDLPIEAGFCCGMPVTRAATEFSTVDPCDCGQAFLRAWELGAGYSASTCVLSKEGVEAGSGYNLGNGGQTGADGACWFSP